MGEATPVDGRQSGTRSGRFDPARLISVIGKVPGSATSDLASCRLAWSCRCLQQSSGRTCPHSYHDRFQAAGRLSAV